MICQLMICQFIGVDVKRRFRRRHVDMLLCGRSQNQLKVFVHQAQRKLRTEIVERRLRQLSHMSWSDHSCLRQDFEQPLAIETSFLPKDHSFSDRLHANTQQCVDNQLHRRPRTRTAQKKVLFCDRLEDWLSGAEQFSVATYE